MLSRIRVLLKLYSKRITAATLALFFSVLHLFGISYDIGGVHDSLYDWFAYDFAYSTEKFEQSDTLGYDETFEMKLAKNEREGCQFVLRERIGNEYAVVEFGEFVNENGDVLESEVFLENYMVVGGSIETSGTYPDALKPYTAKSMEYTRHENNVFYIEVRSTADTPAGTYTAKITVTTDDEKQNIEAEVTATVWDFTLSQSRECKTAVGLNGGIFKLAAGLENSSYGVNTWLTFYDGSITLTPEQEAVYKEHYDFLLEHGLCANFLPYDILDIRAEEYMSDPRVTSFCIPYPKEDDEKLADYYEKVTSNSEWAAKAYFYPVDEPFDSQRYENFKVIVERLKRLCPGYNMIVPFGDYTITDAGTGQTVTGIEIETDNVNMICPISDYFEDEDMLNWLNDRKAQGDSSWWYVCCGPSAQDGYCNLFTYQEGIKPRLLFWQQAANDVTGFLYYETASWAGKNPWLDSRTWSGSDRYEAAGDGNLLYPGKYIGVSSPVASLRLKNIANGIEDYEYLSMARELFGQKWIDAKIALITRSMTDYTSSDKLLENVRNTIGDAISEY